MSKIVETEKTADVSDQASQLEEIATQESVRRTLARIEKVPEEFDGINCVECGQPIPEARLKLGAFRDIQCQERIELYRKNHRSFYEQ